MSIEATALSIPDVGLLKTKKHHDERGHFVETYNRASLARIGISVSFVQDNESLSVHPGTIRGLHFQAAPHAQAKLIRVIQGRRVV